jgi:PhnB protein
MSETAITPYLFFGGRCEEALEFYRQALGAKVNMVMRFNESPDPTPPGMLPPGFESKIMHSELEIRGARLLASDGCETGSKFNGFRLALTVPSEADARKLFDALAAGGSVEMPLTPTFWSPCYGMVTDKFQVGWMVMVPGPQPG